MAIKIKLSSGEEILLRGVTLDAVRKAFNVALGRDELFEISNGNGRALALNPREILSLEQIPDPAAAA
jgi:hypothetical protein